MYRFLLRPGWIAGIITCLLAVLVMVGLGRWQLDRLETKRDTNAAIVAARSSAVEPFDAVLPTSAAQNPRSRDQWRRVEVTGTYLPDRIVLQRGRTMNGEVGFELLVPMQSTQGTVVLVDRGWVKAPPEADKLPDLPVVPTGEVTVTGWVRLSTTASDSTTQLVPIQGVDTIRAISSGDLAEQLSLPLRGGYVSATQESPEPSPAVMRAGLPDLDDGPHLSYAFQWFLFAAMSPVGFVVFARREAADRRRRQLDDDSDDHDDDLDGPDPDRARPAAQPAPVATGQR